MHVSYRALWCSALLAFLISQGALAQDVDCENPFSQAEMNICAGMDWKAADVDLNLTWKKVLERAQSIDEYKDEAFPGAKDTLVSAQRAWIEFRDRQCEAESLEVAGGSMMPLIHAGCLARMTRARTKELQGTFPGNGQPQ